MLNINDNCPDLANKNQLDADRDDKGDSCDSRFCFVIYGDEKNCLDPKTTFRVYSPEARIRTGEAYKLPLFANRQNTAIRYTWVVQQRPEGSTATVQDPAGTVRTSCPYFYLYTQGPTPTFTADQPGVYQVKVAAELVFADTVNAQFPKTSSYVVTIHADGAPVGVAVQRSGCAVGGRGSGLAALPVLLVCACLVLARRRGWLLVGLLALSATLITPREAGAQYKLDPRCLLDPADLVFDPTPPTFTPLPYDPNDPNDPPPDPYGYNDDYDEDGREDDVDNCPFVKNKSQIDTDGDGIGDGCDTCPSTGNPKQTDVDGDGIGDACDPDIDNDGLPNAKDNCPDVSNNFNGAQPDTDGDKKGDACDNDDDNDGVLDADDNCPLVANPFQLNSDPNTYGDKCDKDADLDNIEDSKDNCPLVANADQKDADGDKRGDACDLDRDNDGVLNINDNCPDLANKNQLDADRDGKGDSCDSRFCYVLYGDEKNCLDPKTAFRVYSPENRVATGEETRLRLFANRQNTAIRYTWVVESRPEGSEAKVNNPAGLVWISCPFEYVYTGKRIPTLTPDEPGVYQVKVEAELVFADTVNAQFPKKSSYVVTIHADGDAISGCNLGGAQPGHTLLTALLLALLLGVARRRCR